MRWRFSERASSAPAEPRSCGRRRCSRAHLRGGNKTTASRRCPTACISARPAVRLSTTSGCAHFDGTLVPSERGTQMSMWTVVRRPTASTSSAVRPTARQGVERRQQEPREHLRRAHRYVARWRRRPRPALPQRLGRPTVRVWLLDGTLENLSNICTLGGWPSWRCPTTSTRSVTTPSSSSTSTTAPSCAPSSTTQPWCAPGAAADGRRFVSGSHHRPHRRARVGA